MSGALVPDLDLLSPDGMIPASIGRARVNGVAVVDAVACCVALDDLDAHDVKGNRPAFGRRAVRK